MERILGIGCSKYKEGGGRKVRGEVEWVEMGDLYMEKEEVGCGCC